MPSDPFTFSPARLSPRAVTPRPVALPYGLVWNDLVACLPGAGSLDDARSVVAFEKSGAAGSASSMILTVRYPDVDGAWRELTVFVKESADAASSEADRYPVLRSLGVPTPDLLTVALVDGRPVLVLEFLPVIGVDGAGADDLIDLVATINGVQGAPLPLFAPKPGMPTAEFEALVFEALTALERMSPLLPAGPVELTRSYRAASEELAQLPTALNHGELYFQQVGRTSAGGLVVFDLETMAIRPRFVDIAAVLGGIARISQRPEREAFDHYLRALRARTGAAVAGDPWRDLLLTRAVSTLESLPWLVSGADDPDLGFDADETAATLRADLTALGLVPF
jgi:hypothetical protein